MTQCKRRRVVLCSPLGKIEIFGCETGVHEIRLEEKAESQNG